MNGTEGDWVNDGGFDLSAVESNEGEDVREKRVVQ